VNLLLFAGPLALFFGIGYLNGYPAINMFFPYQDEDRCENWPDSFFILLLRGQCLYIFFSF
jgi:hypothetical protein